MDENEKECIWEQVDDWDESASWSTSCGEMFTFIEDTPKGNGMKFCCYCGLPLRERLAESPNMDEEDE